VLKRHEEILLALLASTVDRQVDRCAALLPADAATWQQAIALASKHGVAALAFSAIEQLPKPLMPPMEQLISLLGRTEYQKARYQSQFRTAQKFAAALKAKGVEMKVLKGISFSTYYDHPELRECGDCDCYLELLSASPVQGEKNRAGATGFEIGNKTIEEIGGRGEFGSYKHSHLYLDQLMFENHHYITDFNGTKQGKKTELLLEQAIESEPGTLIADSDMLRPCAHFSALHCLRHAQGNLMLGGISLRMLYDWAMILRAEQENLDWRKLGADLYEMRLRPFAEVMTSICEQYLGLKITAPGAIRCKDTALIEEVLLDTLRCDIHPKSGETFTGKTRRIWKRFLKMYHFRGLAVESVPTMIWNCFAFSSYMKREIEL